MADHLYTYAPSGNQLAIHFNSVDLPDPLRPAIPNHSPDETDKETFSRWKILQQKNLISSFNLVITLIGVNVAVEGDR